VDDRKNLPEHEALIRRYCATTSEPKSEFTEKKLLYRRAGPVRQFGHFLDDGGGGRFGD
jgi:hypothetical protein